MSDLANTSTDDKGKEGEVSSSCDSSTASTEPLASNSVLSETISTEASEREQDTVFEPADTSVAVAEPAVSETTGNSNSDVRENSELVSTCQSSPQVSTVDSDNNISTTCEMKPSVRSCERIEDASNSNIAVSCLPEPSLLIRNLSENEATSTSSADSTTTSVGSTEQNASKCQEKEVSTTGDDSNPVSTSFVTPTSLALALNQCSRTKCASVSINSNPFLPCQTVHASISKSPVDAAQSSGISTTSMMETSLKSNHPNKPNLSSEQYDVLPSTSRNNIEQCDSDSRGGVKFIRNSVDPVSSSRDVGKPVLNSLPSGSSNKYDECNIDTTTHMTSHPVTEHSGISNSVSGVGVVDKNDSNVNCVNATACSSIPACGTNTLSQDVASSSTSENVDGIVLESVVIASNSVAEVQPSEISIIGGISAHCEVSTSVDKQVVPESTANMSGNKELPSPSPPASAQSPETSDQSVSVISAVIEASSEAEFLGEQQLTFSTCSPSANINIADCEPNLRSNRTLLADESDVSKNMSQENETVLPLLAVASPTSNTKPSPSDSAVCDGVLTLVTGTKPQDTVKVDSNSSLVATDKPIEESCSALDKLNTELTSEELNSRKKTDADSPHEPQLLGGTQQVSACDKSSVGFVAEAECLVGTSQIEKSDPGTEKEKLDPSTEKEKVNPGTEKEKLDPDTKKGILDNSDPGTEDEKLDLGTEKRKLDPGTGKEKLDLGTKKGILDKLDPGTEEKKLVPGTEEKKLVPGIEKVKLAVGSEKSKLDPGTEKEKLVPDTKKGILDKSDPGTVEEKLVPGTEKEKLALGSEKSKLDPGTEKEKLDPDTKKGILDKSDPGTVEEKLVPGTEKEKLDLDSEKRKLDSDTKKGKLDSGTEKRKLDPGTEKEKVVLRTEKRNLDPGTEKEKLDPGTEKEKFGAVRPMSSAELPVSLDEVLRSRQTTSVPRDCFVHAHERTTADSDHKEGRLEASDSDPAQLGKLKCIQTSVENEIKRSSSDSRDCNPTISKQDEISQSRDYNLDGASAKTVKGDIGVMNVFDNISKTTASSSGVKGGSAELQNEAVERKLLQDSGTIGTECKGIDFVDSVELKESADTVTRVRDFETSHDGRSRTEDSGSLLNAVGVESNKPITFSKLIKPLTVNLTDISKLEKIPLGTGATVLFKDLLNSLGTVCEGNTGELKTSDLPVPKIVLSRLKSEVTGTVTVMTGSERNAQEIALPTHSKNCPEQKGNFQSSERNKQATIAQTTCQEGKSEVSLTLKEQLLKKSSNKSVTEPHTTGKTVGSEKKFVKIISEVSKQELHIEKFVPRTTTSDNTSTKYLQKNEEVTARRIDKSSCSESGRQLVTTLNSADDSQISRDIDKCAAVVSDDTSSCHEAGKGEVKTLESTGGSQICKNFDKSKSAVTGDISSCHELTKDKPVEEFESSDDIDKATSVVTSNVSGKEIPVTELESTRDKHICKDVDKGMANVVTSDISDKENSVTELEPIDSNQLCKDVSKSVSVDGAISNRETPVTELEQTDDLQIDRNIDKATSVVATGDTSDKEHPVTESEPTDDLKIGKNIDKATSVVETGNISGKDCFGRKLESTGDKEICKDVDKAMLVVSDDISSRHESGNEKLVTTLELTGDSHICKDDEKSASVSVISDITSSHELDQVNTVTALEPSGDSLICKNRNKSVPVVETVDTVLCRDSEERQSGTELEPAGGTQVRSDDDKSTSVVTGDISCHDFDKEKLETVLEPGGDSQICKDTDKHTLTQDSPSEAVKRGEKIVVTDTMAAVVVCDQNPSAVTYLQVSDAVKQGEMGPSDTVRTSSENVEKKKQPIFTSGPENLDRKKDGENNSQVTLGKAKEVDDSSDSSSSKEGKLVEKITLKLKKDGADSFIATHKKIKIPLETASDKVNIIEKETQNPEKIMLKLKKDSSKSDAFIVSSSEKPADVQSEATGALSDKCPERIMLKLKKHSSKSEQFVLSSTSEATSEGMLSSNQSGDAVDSHSICEEPALEKITLKRMKAGSNTDVFIATSSKDIHGQDSAGKTVTVVAQKVSQRIDKVADVSKSSNELTAQSSGQSNVTIKKETKSEENISKREPGQSVKVVKEGVLQTLLESNSSANTEHKRSPFPVLSETKRKEGKREVELNTKVTSKPVIKGEEMSLVSRELKSDFVVPVSGTVEKPSKQPQEQVVKPSKTTDMSRNRGELVMSDTKSESGDGSGKGKDKSELKQHGKKTEFGAKDNFTELPQLERNKGEVNLKRKTDVNASTLVTKRLKDVDVVATPGSTSGSEMSVAALKLHEGKSSLQSDHSRTDVASLHSLSRKVSKDHDLEASSSSDADTKSKALLNTASTSDVLLASAENVSFQNIPAGKKMVEKGVVVEQITAESKAGTSAAETEEIKPLASEITQEGQKSHGDHLDNHALRHDVKVEEKVPTSDVAEPKAVCEKQSTSRAGDCDTVAKLTSKKSEHVEQNVHVKGHESSCSDENKPGKITLTLKKSAAWSVKQPGCPEVGMVSEGSEKLIAEAVESEVVVLGEHQKGASQGAELANRKRESDHNYTAAPAPVVKKQRTEDKHSLKVQPQLEGSTSMRPKKIAEKRLFETLRSKECDVKRAKVETGKYMITSTKAASAGKVVPQETRVHKKEAAPKPSVEDKLRQILSRMGSKVSSVFNNEVSITLTAPKSSAKAGPASNLKFSDSCEIEVTPEVNIIGSEVDVIAEGEDSNSQDVVILEEKIFTRKQSNVVNVEGVDSVFLKKSRGRPRKAEVERQRQTAPPLAPSPAVLVAMPSRPKRTCRVREEKPLSQPKAKKPRVAGVGRGRKKQFDVGSGSLTCPLPAEVKSEARLKPSTMAALLKTVSIVKIKPPTATQAVVSIPSHSSAVAQFSSSTSSASRPALVMTPVSGTKPTPRTFSRVMAPKVSVAPARSTNNTTSISKSRFVSGAAITTCSSTSSTAPIATAASLDITINVTSATSTGTASSSVVTTNTVATTCATAVNICSDAITATAQDTSTSIFTTAASPEVITSVAAATATGEVTTNAGPTPAVSATPSSSTRPAPPGSPCPVPPSSSVQMFEEETRMSAESNSRSQTPARSLPTAVTGEVVGEESQGSVVSTATTESNKNRKNRMEIPMDTDNIREFTVDMLAEYLWPPDKNGEHLMVQEQISQYLGVKSFKRKYPNICRRPVEAEEKTYLREKGLVSEYMSDLGLTAVVSSEILDIMYTDFQEKYEEYRRYMRDRQAKEFTSKQKAISAVTSGEKSKQDYKEKAVSSAATWNSTFNRSRKEERRCSFDLQNFGIHYPQNRRTNMTLKDLPKVGYYPISLIPGQYTDYYKRYTPTELRYFPLNTILYGPMKPNERQEIKGSDGSQSDSDDSSSSDSSSSCSSEDTQDTDDSASSAGEGDGTDVPNQTPIKTEAEGEKEAPESAACKVCQGGRGRNKDGRPEILIHCGQCGSSSKWRALALPTVTVSRIC